MRLITVRGIGEALSPHPNMLDQFAVHFPNTERYDLPWSAVYGPVGGNIMGESFSSAVERGEAILIDEIRKGPVIVVGYSGGAELAGNVATRFRDHPNLVFAGLVADPSAPSAITGLPGIRGGRYLYEYAWNIQWASNPKDVICSCPVDSPLRAIAKTSEGFSLGDPKFWTRDLLDELRRGKIWRWIFGDYRKYERAYVDACGYLGLNPLNPSLPGVNQHTSYHDEIEELAWKAANAKRDWERANG